MSDSDLRTEVQNNLSVRKADCDKYLVNRPLLPFAVREQLAANFQKAEKGQGNTDEGPLAKHVRKAIEEYKEEYRAVLQK